jgi:hypothetical protein
MRQVNDHVKSVLNIPITKKNKPKKSYIKGITWLILTIVTITIWSFIFSVFSKA